MSSNIKVVSRVCFLRHPCSMAICSAWSLSFLLHRHAHTHAHTHALLSRKSFAYCLPGRIFVCHLSVPSLLLRSPSTTPSSYVILVWAHCSTCDCAHCWSNTPLASPPCLMCDIFIIQNVGDLLEGTGGSF